MTARVRKIIICALLLAVVVISTGSVFLLNRSKLEVHFLDVGQGDAALLICDGEAMLIDGGPPSSSDLVFSYLKSHSVTHLRYIVNSHPEEDHIGGLSGALNYAFADMALCPVDNFDSDAFHDFEKYLKAQNVSVTVPRPGDRFFLGKATITILAPTALAENTNNNSLVLKVEHGKNSFLFTGDAELEEECDLLASGRDLESTVLKVGHHGSSTSTAEDFLSAVSPGYAVISAGVKNAYGHPTEETLNKLEKRNVTLYRTDLYGTVICSSDGKSLSFFVQKNGQEDPYHPADFSSGKEERDLSAVTRSLPGKYGYVLNRNTGKFHAPDCPSVSGMKEKNKIYTNEAREEIIAKGYTPCDRCKP